MYAFLKKLERLQYVEAQIELQGTRPPRKIFRLTPEGEDIFLQWLIEAVEKPRDIRILFLIKLYFIQRLLPHQTSYLVDQQVTACQEFLQHLESLHTQGHKQPDASTRTDDDPFFSHVVLRSRIYQTHALLAWLRELQNELAQVPTSPV
jgi:DNA-binding PadR family transcriptional regulator